MHRAGWSQAEAARRLDITPGAVSQIVSGATRPRQLLINLLRLIVREPQQGAAVKTKHSPPNKQPRAIEIELLANFRRLPESQQQLVLKLARELATPAKPASSA